MKIWTRFFHTMCACLLAVAFNVSAQNSAFTYQGRLTSGGSAANGTFDLHFNLFATPTGGIPIAGPIESTAVTVSNGLFTVVIDLGSVAFDGNDRWLELGVRTNGSLGSYTFVAPRQQVTSSPYSIRAARVDASGLTGTVSDSALSSNIPRLDGTPIFSGTVSFSSPGAPFAVSSVSKVNNLNADLIDGLDSSRLWKTTGNTGLASDTFLGTTDSQSLELRVNNTRALRLSPTTDTATRIGIVNVIAGSSGNTVSAGVYGATIAGGGAVNYDSIGSPNNVTGDFGTVGGGILNTSGTRGTVAGGSFNNATGTHGAVSGGHQNKAYGYGTSVGGGVQNIAGGASDFSSISGGEQNTLYGTYGFLGGGRGNYLLTDYATIVGGAFNTNVNGVSGFIGGGSRNLINGGPGATIVGGYYNTNSSSYAAIGGGQQNHSSASETVIGGGYGNKASALNATVGGGRQNTASSIYATVSGGGYNSASANGAVVAGGQSNSSTGTDSAVGGGTYNNASGTQATIPGGYANTASANYSFAAGRNAKAIMPGAFVWADSTDVTFDPYGQPGPQGIINSFNVRATGGFYIATAVNPTNGVITSGVQLNGGSGTWASVSDRNAKENFEAVDTKQVLARVAEMPMLKWNYKAEDDGVRHIGPMAQDFHKAFELGADNKHITTVDADGIALAAIQGLNEVVKEKEARISDLEKRLSELEKLIQSLSTKH